MPHFTYTLLLVALEGFDRAQVFSIFAFPVEALVAPPFDLPGRS